MRSYEDFIARKTRQFGARFDASDLDPRFIPYYEEGLRIRVITPEAQELEGCVGVSRNSRPTFLLLRRIGTRRALRVLRILGPTDRIVGVRIDRQWRPVSS